MLEYILFVVGLIILVKGADFLVDGSSVLAKKLGVPTLIIGLTVVAFGTSMPELVVNVFAALEGSTGIAFGNIIGSNISNILLVLGITALIYPISVHRSTIWKELPFAVLAVVVLFIVSNDFIIDGLNVFSLTRVDGFIMLIFFAVFLLYIFSSIKRNKKIWKDKKIEIKQRNNIVIALMIIGGIAGLFLGGKWVVDGAIYIANQFGLSEFLISATIIAVGTSLPELVVSVRAAMKKDIDLAVGNIIGSNIFNIFWILGITSVIAPVAIPSFVNIDILVLLFATLLLFLFMFVGDKHKLGKKEGIIFLLLYVTYIVFLVMRG